MKVYKKQIIVNANKTIKQDEKSDLRNESVVAITSLLCDLIAEFNVDSIRDSLKGNADSCAKIVSSFTRLSQSVLAHQKFRHIIT